MKNKTPREALKAYVPDLPKKGAAHITRLIMGLMQISRPAKFFYRFDKRMMKNRPVLILAQHASSDDPYDVIWGYPFVRPNAIMSMHQILRPGLFRLLMADGVILKSLYEPDIAAMRSMLRLRKKNASFVLFPEGVQSIDGTMQPLHPATAKLVKKLAMDTVLCTSHGAYLSRPHYAGRSRRGRKEYTYELLFRKEEIQRMAEEDLYAILLEKFRYNDFLWNEEKQFRYRGKVSCAEGIDSLLFICPRCRRQFSMRVAGDRLVCECGNAVTIDDRYNLLPENGSSLPFTRIDEWYRWQQTVIEEETKREDFRLRYKVTYRMLNLDKLSRERFANVGEGQVELDRTYFRYTGKRCGETVDLKFHLARIPSMPLPGFPANEFYYDGVFHMFVPQSDARLAVKLLLAVEALHNQIDPVRKRVFDDVHTERNAKELIL